MSRGKNQLIHLTQSRQWQPASMQQLNSAVIGARQVEFSIVTYNILSEQLLSKSSYFHKIDPCNWARPLRHELLLAELDCLKADIVCLQEVDTVYWNDQLQSAMQQRGYACASSWRRDGEVKEGVVTCVSESKFSLMSSEARRVSDFVDDMIDASNNDDKQNLHDYADAPQCCVIVQLRHRRSQNQLTVGNVHISYQRPPKHDLRAAQAAAIATAIQSLGNPAVLCGDFNSTPESLAYAAVTGNQWHGSSGNNDWPLLPLLQRRIRAGDFLESAFAGAEPQCTLNLTNNAGCVDFIFHSAGSLRCIRRLPPACERILRSSDSAPDGVLPSDHLSIAAVLAFVP